MLSRRQTCFNEVNPPILIIGMNS